MLIKYVRANKQSSKIEELGVNIEGHIYNNLRYADDTTLCANTIEKAEELIKCVNECEKTGDIIVNVKQHMHDVDISEQFIIISEED